MKKEVFAPTDGAKQKKIEKIIAIIVIIIIFVRAYKIILITKLLKTMLQKTISKLGFLSRVACLLACMLVFIPMSCEKTAPKVPKEKAEIVVAPGSLAIVNNGLDLSGESSSHSVSFTSTKDWTITIVYPVAATKANSWVRVSPMSGKAGAHNIKIEIDKNLTDRERLVNLLLKSLDLEIEIPIRQKPLNIPVQSIILNRNYLNLTKGASEVLTAIVKPDNATYRAISWSSSNSQVATVDNNGKVVAKGGGKAVISATAGGQTATCEVTVSVPVSSVSLNKTNLTMVAGATEVLTATITPADATDKIVIWSSSNPQVATVSENGTIKALLPGTTQIKATCAGGGRSATCTVKVLKDGSIGDRDGEVI